MFIEKQSMTFVKQNPKKEINLLKHFTGHASHIQLWSVKKDLPIMFDTAEINSEDSIASYDLTQYKAIYKFVEYCNDPEPVPPIYT